MRIQHNISAMNAHRQLGGNNTMVSKNLEKLSSGYRINRAGDDAAGLAISEKMRAQIKGLETAQKNANDGISLVQTAEGALTEVHSMLNRMVELATQSANGTYDNETDRANLQKEVKSLQTEIDRIADSTNYNGIKLLDGSLSEGASVDDILNGNLPKAIVATGDMTVAKNEETKSSWKAKNATTGVTTTGGTNTYKLSYMDENGKTATKEFSITLSSTAADATPSIINDAIKAAVAADKELSALFEVSAATSGTDQDKLTFTSKTTGKSAAKVTDFTTVKAEADGGSIAVSSWKADSASTALGANGTAGYTISYTDKNGVSQTKDIVATVGGTAASDINDAIASAIAADADLKDLFIATGATGDILEIKAKSGGGAKITGFGLTTAATAGAVTGAVVEHADKADGADRSVTLTLKDVTSATAPPANGSTVTIGDKTYEILDDLKDVKEGNIGVQRDSGALGGENTTKNLVEALKQNGVNAAVNATNSYQIDIKNLDEISASQQGIIMESDSAGVFIENTVDVAGEYGVTATAGTAGKHKVTVDYLDKEGKKQSLTVDYELDPAKLTSTDVAKAMKEALENDKTFSELFEVKEDPTNAGGFSFVAKDAGTSGASITNVKNDELDQTTNGMSGGVTTVVEAKDAGKNISLSKDLRDGDTITVDGKTYQFTTDPSKVKDGNIAVTFKSAGKEPTPAELNDIAKNLANALKSNGADMSYDSSKGVITFKNDAKSATEEGMGLVLQVGDSSEDYQKVTVKVGKMDTESLGIKDIDISTQKGAQDAIDKIKSAINQVSSTRGDLGAIQNRLEHTINNLGVAAENMTAAEARIRDVDMAKEMMDFTKNNILTQASQSMLAQANQLPQGVLQLLQ